MRRGEEFRLACACAAALAAALSVACARGPQTQNAAAPTPQAAASPVPWKTIEPPAQVGAPSGSPRAQQTPAGVKSYNGVGVVRLINLEEGWLEIDHEEIKGFMAAMQMEWSVRDKALLKSVRVGDRVNFTVEDDNGTEVITELKKAPAAPQR
ncbi:MAG TPA: copper-binding protein [Pyrinomonadaceae bacterium]|nr:copper-binding protein [Pyrinomonadaceae bacterium]